MASWTTFAAFAFAAVSGALVAAQPAFNGELARLLGSPVKAAFVSFSAGTLILAAALVATRAGAPDARTLASVPPHLFVAGGLLGAIFVTAAAWSVPRIGVGAYLAILVAAQLVAALAMDHFGLIGLAERTLTPARAAGAALLFAGAWLVTRT